MPDEPDDPRFCPLVNRNIDAGLCLEVNYERLGYFKPGALSDVLREAGVTVEQVSATCEACPHQPVHG